MPLGGYESALAEQLKSAVPYIPNPNRRNTVSVEWVAATVLLVLMAYLHLSLLWIAIVGATAAAWLYKASTPGDIGDATNLGGAGIEDTQQREAVLWV
jgi:tetrahydromethanopterin S-methyltransferase subunit E